MKTNFFRKKSNRLPLSVLLLCPVLCVAQDAIMVGTSTSYSIRSVTDATGSGHVYRWLENGVELPGAIDATYTNPLGKAIVGEYTYVRLAKSPGCEAWVSSNAFKVIVNNPVTYSDDTFENFAPDPLGKDTMWTLTDTRDNKTYVVKRTAENRMWMVQDLKFGNCVNDNTTTWYEDNSYPAVMHTPTVADGYIGHCRSTTYTGAGYLYNWPAVMQHKAVYYGGSNIQFSCSGYSKGLSYPNPAYCRGICPVGWHVPTSAEFYYLRNALRNNGTIQIGIDNFSNYAVIDGDPRHWHGVSGGYCNSDGSLQEQGNFAHYWSTTRENDNRAYIMLCGVDTFDSRARDKNQGRAVRCVRNY
jgi:uncharacterized protein (TIGR02145 family)